MLAHIYIALGLAHFSPIAGAEVSRCRGLRMHCMACAGGPAPGENCHTTVCSTSLGHHSTQLDRWYNCWHAANGQRRGATAPARRGAAGCRDTPRVWSRGASKRSTHKRRLIGSQVAKAQQAPPRAKKSSAQRAVRRPRCHCSAGAGRTRHG